MVVNCHTQSGSSWLWVAGLDRMTVNYISVGTVLNGVQETKHFTCFCAHFGKGKPFFTQIF